MRGNVLMDKAISKQNGIFSEALLWSLLVFIYFLESNNHHITSLKIHKLNILFKLSSLDIPNFKKMLFPPPIHYISHLKNSLHFLEKLSHVQSKNNF